MRYIRVFVSSPGDCSEQRDTLEHVAKRINDIDADRTGIHVRVFRWEDDIVPRIGPPPQAVVDEQTPLCEIYIGIMSARFGGDDTRESGTEHEFRQALDRFGATGVPWVLFYFDDTPPTPKSVAEAKQLMRVLEFREELEKRGIVDSYSGVRGSENGFFERVDLHLRRLLQRPEFSSTALVDTPRGGAAKNAARSADIFLSYAREDA